ncbi:RTA1-domain-containing protein [Auriculariales sp. MPI-PUGE-AT-0066]|nr:RTA1-domain-containing protein [Auriculariales sp. MPI-PUGE-AT-0066]
MTMDRHSLPSHKLLTHLKFLYFSLSHFAPLRMAGHPEKPLHPTPEQTPYGYYVLRGACIIFLLCFGITTTLHIIQGIYHRGARFMLWTAVLCGLGELIGWGGRLWSANDPAAGDAFLMQIATTIISPTFLVAANFIILGRVIHLVGPQFSRLTPAMYSKVFLTADFLALVIQAIGGASASMSKTPEGGAQGAKIMLVGIGIQFAALSIYAVLAAEFLLRVHLDRPLRPVNFKDRNFIDSKLKAMIIGLIISAFFLFTRTIYRTIELTDGWNGSIIRNQQLFNWLDGMPITVAMFTLNFLHPGRLVYNKDRAEPDNMPIPLKSSRLSSREELAPYGQA